MRRKILITDKVHQLLLDGLVDLGYDVDYHPKMPYPEVCERVGDYDAIIINSKVICDRSFLASNTHLDFIGRLGSGLDIIDLKAAKELGVTIISSPEGNANAVAEHALGMLLMLKQKMYPAFEQLKQGKWVREEHRGEALIGKTIGVIGYGHTGPAFTEKLSGMSVDILAYDKYVPEISDEGVQQVSLKELQERSDIVSIHLPLTDETKFMVDEAFLSSLKKGAIIINTSRGKILDSAALLRKLSDGSIGGACLDVLENEKPETWSDEERSVYMALIDHTKVVITPHVAGWTHRSLLLIAEVLLKKIANHPKSSKKD